MACVIKNWHWRKLTVIDRFSLDCGNVRWLGPSSSIADCHQSVSFHEVVTSLWLLHCVQLEYICYMQCAAWDEHELENWISFFFIFLGIEKENFKNHACVNWHPNICLISYALKCPVFLKKRKGGGSAREQQCCGMREMVTFSVEIYKTAFHALTCRYIETHAPKSLFWQFYTHK